MDMEAELLQGVCASVKDTKQTQCLLVSYDAFVKINCQLCVCVCVMPSM